VALLITESLTWGLHYYFVRRDISHLRFATYLVRPVIAGAIMSAVLLLLGDLNFFLLTGIAGAVYLAGMLLLQPSILRDFKLMFAGGKQ
jgi:uncharacterized RDD family membrane protein YckC